MSGSEASVIAQQLGEAAAQAAANLRASGVVPEALGELQPARKRMFGTRAARIVRVGAVWRLGVFLLAADAAAVSFAATLTATGPLRTAGRKGAHTGTAAHIDATGNPTAVFLVAGPSLRAHEPPRVLGYTSESARVRDELRHAAIRGGFAEGEVVHYNATQLTAPETPLAVRDGQLVVRWAPGTSITGARPFPEYLAERIAFAGGIAP